MPIAQCSRSRVSSLIYALLIALLLTGLVALLLRNVYIESWLITSCRSANNIMPITIFLPAFIASFFYSA